MFAIGTASKTSHRDEKIPAIDLISGCDESDRHQA
jgi:hypothetical protein